jgi:cell division protein FtsX
MVNNKETGMTNGVLNETKTDIRISKWVLKSMIGVFGVILCGFTYLYGQDQSLQNEINEKVPIEVFKEFKGENEKAHEKLEEQLDDMQSVQNSTNLAVGRIEVILEERLRQN